MPDMQEEEKRMSFKVLGIDPGISGAFVMLYDGDMEAREMPTCGPKDNDIDFQGVVDLLDDLGPDHIFLERAIPFAMGSKSAFEYGRGFRALEIAIQQCGIPCTYIEPAKWTKVMCDGIDAELKPKVRAAVAVRRLFPSLASRIPVGPKSKKLDEGVVDALLIAAYGKRILNQ